MRGLMVSLFTGLVLSAIAAHTSSALTISGTAPAYADSAGSCEIPNRVARVGAMQMIVRLESGDQRDKKRVEVPAANVVRTDSLTVNMASSWSISVPNPGISGPYTVRAYGRRALSTYGCDVAILFMYDTFAPAKPLVIVR